MGTVRARGVLTALAAGVLLASHAWGELSVEFHGLSTFHVAVHLYGSPEHPWRLTTYRNGDHNEVGRGLLSSDGELNTRVAVELQPGEDGVTTWGYGYLGIPTWSPQETAPFRHDAISGTPDFDLADPVVVDGGDRDRLVPTRIGTLVVPGGRTLQIRNVSLADSDGTVRVEGLLDLENAVVCGARPRLEVVGDGALRARDCAASTGPWAVADDAGRVELSDCDLTGLVFDPLGGTVTMDDCRVEIGTASTGTGRLVITNSELRAFSLLSGPEAECRIESSVLHQPSYAPWRLDVANLGKLTLDDCLVESEVRATDLGEVKITKSEFHRDVTLTLTDTCVGEISRNAWTGQLGLAGTANPGLRLWANDFVGQSGLLANATGFDLRDANYWGTEAGPSKGLWLDPGGAAVGGVTVEAGDIATWPFGWSEDGRVSSRTEARPFPPIWLAGWQLGQNVMGRYSGLLPRVGRDTLLVFDLRTSAARLEGVSFSLRWDDNLLSPEPGFELVRDHGPAPAIVDGADPYSAGRALCFIIPAGLTGGAEHRIELTMDTRAVTGYATPGTVTTLMQQVRAATDLFNPQAFGRRLNILVVNVVNLTAGYDPINLIGPGARELADYLGQAIPAVLPVRPEDLCVLPGPPYTFISWYASTHEVFQPWMLGWLIAELDAYRWLTNEARVYLPSARGERFDFIVGVVADDNLGGESGLMWGMNRRAVLVRSGALPLALHELGHCWGLYLGTEQYDLRDGPDDAGNIIGEYSGLSGALVEGLTAFNPEPTQRGLIGGLSGRVTHFPAGNGRGILDFMSNSRAYWIVPSSLSTAYFYLQEFLGTAEPAPNPPAPLVRRLRLSGRFEKNRTWDPPEFRLAGTVACQRADNLLGGYTGQRDTGLRFRAYDRDGNVILDQPCKHEVEVTVDNWTTVVWNQTFDVPATAYSYAVVRRSGNTWKALYTGTDFGTAPSADLRGPEGGDLKGRTLDLAWGGSREDGKDAGHPLATQPSRRLFYSTDGGASWVPIGGDLEGDSISLPTGFLPRAEALAFKLVTADGFRTAESVLTGYSMSARPPAVTILSPQAGDAAGSDTLWSLAAEATSPEGDSLTAVWDSDRDGSLGSGFRLQGVALSEGDHVLTCTVSAGGGSEVTASVAVTVSADAAPDLRLAADALTIRRHGQAPELYCPNRPQVGVVNDVVLRVRNPGVACRVQAQLYVSAPGSRDESLLAEQTADTTPFQAFDLTAAYTPPAPGAYQFRASLSALDAVDPVPGNNDMTWAFANEPPVARGLTVRGEVDQDLVFALEAEDPDNGPLVYEILTPPVPGTLSGTAPALTFTPPPGAAGSFPLTFRVSDGLEWSAPATVTLLVSTSTEPTQMTLVTRVDPEGAGTIGPFLATSVPIVEALAVPLAAQAAAGYEFLNWTLAGNANAELADANSAATAVTGHMVSWFGNTVVATANFRRLPTEARLHFATNGRGYVSLTPTGDQVSLDLDVLLGQDSPPVHAIAGTGYEFANWTCAGHFISTANPLVVPAVSEDLFIWANFVPAGGGMTLTLVPEPAAGGTVAPAAPVTGIAPEQAVPIQAFAAAGYRFDHWSAAPATATFGSSTAAGTTVTLAETAVVTAHFAPLPVTAAFATAASTTAENAGARPIEVVLGSPSVGTVTVNYGVLGGTATAGEDFLLAPGPLTFLPGETRQSLLLTPLGDGVAEGNETVMLRLTTMVNATMGTPGMHSVTITDSPGWLSVVFLAGPHGSLRGMPVQTVPQGGDTTPVEAVGDDGYEFDRWDDHSPECRDNPRVVRNVTVRTSLTALFRPVVATVAPDGSFEATADARMAADGGGIWDLTGTYAASVKGSLVVLSLVHGTTGKLSGAASYTMAKDTTVSMPVKGSVKGASGSITMKGTLKGTAPDKTVSVALTLNLTVDTANRRLTGPLTGSVKSGGVTTAVNQDLALDLPAGMDGTWTLTLHLAQAGTAVGGTALLTLANGADYAFSVKGKTGPANAAVLTLTGDRADPAAKALKLKAGIVPLADGTARIESLAGKAYGQAITW